MTITPLIHQETTPSGDLREIQMEIPVQETSPLETVMLAQDKLFVVLAVVLIIWFGIIFFIFRTDRKLASLERTLAERIPEEIESI